MLRVQGDKGTLLVPGNIQTVTVVPDASAQQAGVIHLHNKGTLTAARVTELPSSSMMMKPYADRPTIMAITEPQGLIDLVEGPRC